MSWVSAKVQSVILVHVLCEVSFCELGFSNMGFGEVSHNHILPLETENIIWGTERLSKFLTFSPHVSSHMPAHVHISVAILLRHEGLMCAVLGLRIYCPFFTLFQYLFSLFRTYFYSCHISLP